MKKLIVGSVISVGILSPGISFGAVPNPDAGPTAMDGTRGGGDICQERIETIRNNISEWIQVGNSAQLNFAASGTTLTNYDSEMQNVIALTRSQEQTSISCTDDESMVQVGGAQKTCVAYPSTTQPRIVCYRGESQSGQFINGFMGLSDDNQYFQVHHELAVLAGIEDQAGQQTDYPLSDQISDKLVEVQTKQLPVNPMCTANNNNCQPVKNTDPCYSGRPSDQALANIYGESLYNYVSPSLISSGVAVANDPNVIANFIGLGIAGDGKDPCLNLDSSGRCLNQDFMMSDVVTYFFTADGTKLRIDASTVAGTSFATPMGFAQYENTYDNEGNITRCRVGMKPIAVLEVHNDTTDNTLFTSVNPSVDTQVLADYAPTSP